MIEFGLRGAPVRRTVGLVAIAAACMTAREADAQTAGAAKKPVTSKSSATAKAKSAKANAEAAKAAAKVAATPIRFVIGPTGNEARYRVREQLMGANLPNDAIGKTSEITGTILAYPDGRVVRDSSRIVVKVTSLKSDKDRRDGFLQRRTLETEKYPTVELVPTSVRGFSGALPASGPVTFELLGDLTVHGVTRPTVWQVTAHADGQDVAGTATTAFTFKDINLDQPRVPVVLSVADTIKLEYDFRFAREVVKP
ncbi:MAG: YceI family protein [Gemmatimonadetes bacterium]|nr:YceI family protein [Gemmatimonadota bacterium]